MTVPLAEAAAKKATASEARKSAARKVSEKKSENRRASAGKHTSGAEDIEQVTRRHSPKPLSAKGLTEKARDSQDRHRAERSAHKARVKKAQEREQVRLDVAERLIRKPTVRMIAIEYIVAMILAIILLAYTPGATYHDRMVKFFMRSTGISALFFTMAMVGTSKRAARPVILFGILVDLALFFQLMTKNTGSGYSAGAALKTLGGVVSGKKQDTTAPVSEAASQSGVGYVQSQMNWGANLLE